MSADSSGLSSSSSYLYLLYFNCYYSLVFTRPFARVLSCSRCKGKHFPDVSQRFFPKPSGKIPTKDYTTKLIDNAKFSFDPRSEDAVYTMGNIPPSAISIAKWATYNSCSFFFVIICANIYIIAKKKFLRSNFFKKISSKDLPVVCFVVTQHSESALSLCLRYSKTSCHRQPQNIRLNSL